MGRPKLCTNSCRAVLRRRRFFFICLLKHNEGVLFKRNCGMYFTESGASFHYSLLQLSPNKYDLRLLSYQAY